MGKTLERTILFKITCQIHQPFYKWWIDVRTKEDPWKEQWWKKKNGLSTCGGQVFPSSFKYSKETRSNRISFRFYHVARTNYLRYGRRCGQVYLPLLLRRIGNDRGKWRINRHIRPRQFSRERTFGPGL